jgi:dolichol-phosphate mannosyltransferase
VDFVSGMRLSRRDNFVRRASSNIARLVRQRVLKSDFRDTGCAIRAFKRSAMEGLFPFNGLHRFLPLLVHGNGAITLEVPVNHRPRVAGVSKYGVWNRLGRGIYDLFAIAWYQKRRLRPVPFTEFKEKGIDRSLTQLHAHPGRIPKMPTEANEDNEGRQRK